MQKAEILKYLLYSNAMKESNKDQANKLLFIALCNIVYYKIELDMVMYTLIFDDAEIIGDIDTLGITEKAVNHLAKEYHYGDDNTELIVSTMMKYKRIIFLYKHLFLAIGHYYLYSTQGVEQAKELERQMYELRFECMRFCTALFLLTPDIDMGILTKHFDFDYGVLRNIYMFTQEEFTELNFELIAAKTRLHDLLTGGDK